MSRSSSTARRRFGASSGQSALVKCIEDVQFIGPSGNAIPELLASLPTHEPSNQAEVPARKKLAHVQWLEHDLVASMVATFADRAPKD